MDAWISIAPFIASAAHPEQENSVAVAGLSPVPAKSRRFVV
jgi:hypothetical protein